MYREVLKFYRGKRVFLTGHTGFKGSWMTKVLLDAGAKLCGYSLEPPTKPNLFTLAKLEEQQSLQHHIGDIRDLKHLQEVFRAFRPEIVIHMAAQPIVRRSYEYPHETYDINVMGTVNLCECVRLSVPGGELNSDDTDRWNGVRSFLNVTTDKVYENRETGRAFTEEMPLDGYDPYSNSKSCSELVTHSYNRSFFKTMEIAVSTARSGNVIGGGDFSQDRIVPDCVRAVLVGEPVVVRNPVSVRPYQHVLEPLFAYLIILIAQDADSSVAGSYNIGPDITDCVTTGEVVDLFVKKWGDGAVRRDVLDNGPHEAGLLRLNCDKLKGTFGWEPKWNVEKAIEKTVEWVRAYQKDPESIAECMKQQIVEYAGLL